MKYQNLAWNRKAILTITLATLFFGCAQKEEDETPSLGTGGLTAAELAGNRWSACTEVSGNTYGLDVNGMSYMRGLSLVADGTYGISTLFFSGTTCAFGGIHLFTVSQAGMFQTGGLLESGATEIVYNSVGSVLTTYGDGTASPATTWAGYFDTATCAGGNLTINTNATDTQPVTGLTCSNATNPDFSFPQFAPLGATFYDSIALTNPTPGSTIITVGDQVQLWNIGQAGSYPTTATQIFTE